MLTINKLIQNILVTILQRINTKSINIILLLLPIKQYVNNK